MMTSCKLHGLAAAPEPSASSLRVQRHPPSGGTLSPAAATVHSTGTTAHSLSRRGLFERNPLLQTVQVTRDMDLDSWIQLAAYLPPPIRTLEVRFTAHSLHCTSRSPHLLCGLVRAAAGLRKVKLVEHILRPSPADPPPVDPNPGWFDPVISGLLAAEEIDISLHLVSSWESILPTLPRLRRLALYSAFVCPLPPPSDLLDGLQSAPPSLKDVWIERDILTRWVLEPSIQGGVIAAFQSVFDFSQRGAVTLHIF